MRPRLSQPLHPDMGFAVLELLRARSPLPDCGVLAGQSVASALEDCFGRGGGVYNDIDVFRQLPHHAPDRARPTRIAPTLSMCELALARRPHPDSDEYDHLKLVPTLVAQETYRIERTTRRDALNTVFYRAGGMPNADPHRVLRGFDLNCVRVGVDLRSRRLVWTAEYEQFLRTSELRLCAAHTPFHSLLRLLKKETELPDVTLNLEASLALAALMAGPEHRRSLQSRRAATFWYGGKYQALAKDLRSRLGAAFRLETHLLRRSPRGELVRGAGDETAAASLFGTMVPRGLPQSAGPRALPSLSAWPALDVHRLPPLVYAAFEAPSPRSRVSVRGWSALARPGSWTAPLLQAQGDAYAMGWRAKDSQTRLDEALGWVPASLMMGRCAREQLALLDTARDVVAKSGVPDIEHVLRATLQELAGHPGIGLQRACDQVLTRERSQPLSKLARSFVIEEHLWRARLEHPQATLERLDSMRAAREFAHRAGWPTLLQDVPLLDGVLLAGCGLRHPRDVAVLRFETDSIRSGLEWRFQLHRRERMPLRLEQAWLDVLLVLFEDARRQGAVLPFSPEKR